MMLFGNGDRYEGEWVAGKIEGNGTMKYGTGDVYQGSWKSGKGCLKNHTCQLIIILVHGHGVYTQADGNQWEGEFEDGFRIVNGIKYWPDGELYRENEEDTAEISSTENQKSLSQSSSLSAPNISTGSVPPVQPNSGRFAGLRKNMNINKTIEDIKKKNLATGKKN